MSIFAYTIHKENVIIPVLNKWDILNLELSSNLSNQMKDWNPRLQNFNLTSNWVCKSITQDFLKLQIPGSSHSNSNQLQQTKNLNY